MQFKALATTCVMLFVSASHTHAALITFDDYAAIPAYDQIVTSYKGFNWINMWVANKNAFSGTGFAAGTISGNYTGFNGFGQPGEINSPTLFNFSSVYLTGGFDNGPVTITGFLGTTQLYTQTVNVTTTTPQFITFNFNGINRLRFTTAGQHFAMDNLTLNNVEVPEPASLTLLSLGGLGLAGAARRRRQAA